MPHSILFILRNLYLCICHLFMLWNIHHRITVQMCRKIRCSSCFCQEFLLILISKSCADLLQVKEFDSISRLDQWQTTMLLRIKKTIQGDAGDLKWCVQDKYCGIISSLISYHIVCVCDNLVEHFCSDTSSNISRFLENSEGTCIAIALRLRK